MRCSRRLLLLAAAVCVVCILPREVFLVHCSALHVAFPYISFLATEKKKRCSGYKRYQLFCTVYKEICWLFGASSVCVITVAELTLLQPILFSSMTGGR